MGKFDAAKIGGMEYDLTAYRPDPDADGLEDAERDRRRALHGLAWAGVIPEPSREQVAQFFDQMQDVRLASIEESDRVLRERREQILADHRGAHPDDGLTDDEILDRAYAAEPVEQARERVALLQSIRAAAAEKQAARVAELVEELTRAHPPAAVVLELGQRPADMFVGWLSGEFSPESVAAAMQQ